jgi:copper chaperone CopZ
MVRILVVFTWVAAVVGCSHSASDAPQATTAQVTATVFNSAGAPTVQFSVPGMMCETSCAVKTKEILSKVPGARDVVVDFPTKTATVAIEEGKFDTQLAIAELVDHGFDHSTLKGEEQGGMPEKPAPPSSDASSTPPAPAP